MQHIEGVFDNISEVANNVDLDLGRLICMVLEWILSKRLGLRSAFLCCSDLERRMEAWDSTFSSNSLLGILGPGDRRLSVRLALSVTSEESLRYSEPPLNGYLDRRLREV